ncbi:MAG: penicillin-binding protein 2 [Pseudomonadota bacterium]
MSQPAHRRAENHRLDGLRHRRRTFGLALTIVATFGLLAGQLVRHGLAERPVVTMASARPITHGWARPDILDRRGRVLATDVARPSLFADPALIVDVDEVIAFLAPIFPTIEWRAMRDRLDNRARRFVWIARGLDADVAGRIAALGLPGLAFRDELQRRYPAGALTAHTVGHVDIDNDGKAAAEIFLQEVIGVDPADDARRSARPPVHLTLDLGVQHVVAGELSAAMAATGARAAAGLIMDARTGALLASVSLPSYDPHTPAKPRDASGSGAQSTHAAAPQAQRADGSVNRLALARYELGSVMKPLVIAAALDTGAVTPLARIDTRAALTRDDFTITDPPRVAGKLSLEDVFTRSSNVGAATLALNLGEEKLLAAFSRLGVTGRLLTELGRGPHARLPKPWRDVNTMTAGYGYGVATTPLQLAAATASLINGGHALQPHVVRTSSLPPPRRVLRPETSAELRRYFRANVARGTGVRARVPGYDVGGKTGTALRATAGGYDAERTITSFVGAFPMVAPRYVTLAVLFEPKRPLAADATGSADASTTAAPLTARIVRRAAPMLGIAPRRQRSDG